MRLRLATRWLMLITTEPNVGIVMVELRAVTSSPRRRVNDDATLKQ